MEGTIEKLKKYKSSTPSKWKEAAEFRTKNRTWLRYSQSIAMLTADAMEDEGLTQKALAERMGCTQQYVSRILKGQENLTEMSSAVLPLGRATSLFATLRRTPFTKLAA